MSNKEGDSPLNESRLGTFRTNNPAPLSSFVTSPKSPSKYSPTTPGSNTHKGASPPTPTPEIHDLIGQLVHVVSRHPFNDHPRLLSGKPGGVVCLSKDLSENEVWQIKQVTRATKKRQPYLVVELASFWHNSQLCVQQTDSEPKKWILRHKPKDECDETAMWFKLLPSRVVTEKKAVTRGGGGNNHATSLANMSKAALSIGGSQAGTMFSTVQHSVVPPLKFSTPKAGERGGAFAGKSAKGSSRHAFFGGSIRPGDDQPTGRTQRTEVSEGSNAETILQQLLETTQVSNCWLMRCDHAQDWLQQVVRCVPNEGLQLGEILKNDFALLWEFIPAQICQSNKTALTRYIPSMGSVVTITSSQGGQYLSAHRDSTLGLNDVESDREGWMLQVQSNGTVVIYSLSYASAVIARQTGEVRHVQLGQRGASDIDNSRWEFLYDAISKCFVIRSRFYQRLWFGEDATIRTSNQSIDAWSNWKINDSLRAKSQQELQKLTQRETKLLKTLSPMSVALPAPPLPPLRYSTPQLHNTAKAAAQQLSRVGATTAPLTNTAPVDSSNCNSNNLLLNDLQSTTYESIWGDLNEHNVTYSKSNINEACDDFGAVPQALTFAFDSAGTNHATKPTRGKGKTMGLLWPARRPESRQVFGNQDESVSRDLGVGHWSLQYTNQRKNHLLMKIGEQVQKKTAVVESRKRAEQQSNEIDELTQKYQATLGRLSQTARTT